MRRRAALTASAAVLASACAESDSRPRATVAFPERSLTYAPLLLAARNRLDSNPSILITQLQLASGRAVASAVAAGSTHAGTLALPDFLHAAAEGASLIAVGSLTQRAACQLVVASHVPAERTLEAIHTGAWHGLRLGVESGPDGTETFVRFLALARGWSPTPPTRQLLAPDRFAGEPRWLPLETGEALVAALEDNRVDAYFGRPFAAAQSTTLGRGAVALNFATDPSTLDVSAALPAVVIANRDSLDRHAEAIGSLTAGLARAGAALTYPFGIPGVAAALPERDELHLTMALRLVAPEPGKSIYGATASLTAAIERYLELSARAGRPLGLNAGTLVTTRFSG